ncbi:MAG: ribose transport system substrate-binding protein [Solirubrobacteraceae bacterium]|jgi:ribose transport system substrate-binding protein|nr:ribose transport system substrate-binding protein [Solirubrobacteraceae bacterium]
MQMLRRWSVLAAALTLGVTVTACGGDDDTGGSASTGAPAAENKLAGLTYGIPSPLATEPGEHNINLGITCFADANDGKVITLDSKLDVNKQISDFDTLLARGAKVLPFLPLDPKAFRGPFKRAVDADATVVELYNPESTAPGSVYEASEEAGTDAVKVAKAEFPDGAKAILIGGPPIPTVNRRMAGFSDNAKAAGIEVVDKADNLKDNVNDARALADDLITKNPDVNVIFGFNDNSAVGAGLAVKARGLDNVLIFGINGTPEGIDAIKRGLITASYEADQFRMGYLGAKTGAEIRAGQAVKPISIPMKRWDKDNVAEYPAIDTRCAALTK